MADFWYRLVTPRKRHCLAKLTLYVHVCHVCDTSWRVKATLRYCFKTLDRKPRPRSQSYIGPTTVGPVWDVIRAKTTPHIVYDAHHTQNCTVWGPDRCKSGPHTGRMCRSCQNSRRHTDVISKFLYFFIIRRSSLFLVYNNMATLWTCLRGKFLIFYYCTLV